MIERFKKLTKKMDILLIIYVILYVILNIIFYHDNFNLTQILLKPFKIKFMFLNLIFFMLNIIVLIHAIFRISLLFAKEKNQKYEKVDIKYIRDYLTIPPTTMSYIINLDLNIKNDIIAELLSLEMDGYVKRQNNMFVQTDKQISYLPESDLYLIKNLNRGISGSHFKKLVEKELLDNGYIKKKKNNLVKKSLIFLGLVIFGFILLYVGSEINNDIISYIAFSCIFLTGFWFFGGSFIYAIINDYERTEKSNNLLPKILGLGEFLKEFTNINDSRLDELSLKSYYLVYSLTYNLNNDLANSIKIKIY